MSNLRPRGIVSLPTTEEEDSIYFHEWRERLVDDDELSIKEDGFMQGYEESIPEMDSEDLGWGKAEKQGWSP